MGCSDYMNTDSCIGHTSFVIWNLFQKKSKMKRNTRIIEVDYSKTKSSILQSFQINSSASIQIFHRALFNIRSNAYL
jgi:hypothetical protein